MPKLAPFLQTNWEQAGFTKPALIQEKVYEPITTRKSLVGVAPTGSGKTLAYLLPLLNQLTAGEPSQVLILTSSQELAMQVVEVARTWLTGSGMKVQALIGGANVKRQQEGLKKKPELLVGTPGRVLELLKSKKIKAPNIKTIVFDEVDQLLGSQELIGGILQSTLKDTQHLYFSATADHVLAQLQALEPELVVVDVSQEDDSQGEVAHYYIEVSQRKKVDTLRRLLNMDGFWGMIFFNQVADLGAAEQKLAFHGLPIASLASDESKALRKLAIDQFKKRHAQGLLTTDLASRGLDIADLPFVVNADFPQTADSYTHRAGRVGRMGKTGTVISLLAPHEVKAAQKETRKLGIELQETFLHGGEIVSELPAKESQPKPKKKISKNKPAKKKTRRKK